MIPAASETDYRNLLGRLLPRGWIWVRMMRGLLGDVCGALGIELARVHNRARQLVEEADPRTCSETLSDWERNFSLPDPDLPPLESGGNSLLPARNRALAAKVTTIGGNSKPYFAGLAARCGATNIAVIDGVYQAFRVGYSHVGEPIAGAGVALIWRVTCTLDVALRPFLEKLFRDLKPAHTDIEFHYL